VIDFDRLACNVALDAANVATTTTDDELPPYCVRECTLAERITLLVHDRDEARRLAAENGAIIASVNTALGDAGIHCAVTFAEGIDMVRCSRDEARARIHELEQQLADAQHALANEKQAAAGIRQLVDELAHDIDVVTQHRQARDSGGQLVGTGGRLGAAMTSTLIYLERLVRDMRAALGGPK
jgi:hypothetical protein